MNKAKVDRSFCEVDGGYYDSFDFYYTPNGSKITNLIGRLLG